METGFPGISSIKNNDGRGGALIQEGCLFDIMAKGVDAFSGKGTFLSVVAYSRKYSDHDFEVVSNESFCFAL